MSSKILHLSDEVTINVDSLFGITYNFEFLKQVITYLFSQNLESKNSIEALKKDILDLKLY